MKSVTTLAALALAVAVLGLARPAPAADGAAQSPTNKEIDQAIKKGVEYLWSQQQPNGDFGDGEYSAFGSRFKGGTDVLAMLALTYAGIDLKDARARRGLEALVVLDLDRTYTVAMRAMVLSRMMKRLDAKQRGVVLRVLSNDLAWLQAAQLDKGGWSYENNSGDRYRWAESDFSNTQMAVLALAEGVAMGAKLKPDCPTKTLKLYLDEQRPDGGWNYRGARDGEESPSYGSMTASGVASLFLLRDALYSGVGCPCKGDKSSSRFDKLESAIDRGLAWLDKNFSDNKNGQGGGMSSDVYWLYAGQRVGLASGLRTFGSHDWYREGAAGLIKRQRPDGHLGSDTESGDAIFNTAYAVCFLAKGRQPVLLNKLRFKGQWNNHPRDAANLVEFVADHKSQKLGWQVVNLTGRLEDWQEAPILYITPEEPIDLSDVQKKALREFADTGGTIFFESSCGNARVAAWWQKTAKEIWPEWTFKKPAREDPLWTADAKISGGQPQLLSLHDGVRTIVWYSPANISCAWNGQDSKGGNRGAFDLGANLYACAVDRMKLEDWRARREAGVGKTLTERAAALKAGKKTDLTLARVKHGQEWAGGENYHPWSLLAADLEKSAGLKLKELPAVAPGAAVPAEVNCLYLSGRSECDLGPDGAKWLKDYLAGDGFLIAEALCGDTRFEEPLKATLAAAGLELRPFGANNPLVTGNFFDEARGYELRKVGYTATLAAEPTGKDAAVVLQGIYSGKRLVGAYSPYDILFSQTGCLAFGNRGYAADDARALATNLMLLLSAR